jgi:hypothetical protein
MCSPHQDVAIGSKWWLPRGKIGLANSGVAHMDERLRNASQGLHSLDTFWADRFLMDSNDPLSGLLAPEMRTSAQKASHISSAGRSFSLKGLEGSWIPYGVSMLIRIATTLLIPVGGHAICPGRFFSKNVIVTVMAMMVDRYDIEFESEAPEPSTAKFGMGTLGPKTALPVKIRNRRLLRHN